MTGPEHYREAERLAHKAAAYEGLPSNAHVQDGQLAQVHAMLALAAASAAQLDTLQHHQWWEALRGRA